MFCSKLIKLIIRWSLYNAYWYTGILFVPLHEGRVYLQGLAITRMNGQKLTNLYGSIMFCIQHWLALFLGLSKAQVDSVNA